MCVGFFWYSCICVEKERVITNKVLSVVSNTELLDCDEPDPNSTHHPFHLQIQNGEDLKQPGG